MPHDQEAATEVVHQDVETLILDVQELPDPLDVVGPEADLEVPEDLGTRVVTQTADLLGALAGRRV